MAVTIKKKAQPKVFTYGKLQYGAGTWRVVLETGDIVAQEGTAREAILAASMKGYGVRGGVDGCSD
jgi:hypothetical protein